MKKDTMPSIVAPYPAMKSFEPALRAGEIDVQTSDTDDELFIHQDYAGGRPRLTYVRFSGGSSEIGTLTALAMITTSAPYDGLPCFQIGYAVPQHLRKRGFAKDVARAAVADFRAGIAETGVDTFYVEAIVGVANVASQKVAEEVLGASIGEGIDENSGETILRYLRKIEPDTGPI